MLRIWVSLLILCTMLTSCAIPRVAAQDRVFLPLSLEFVDEYQLPKQTFQETVVGGLSGITYDRSRNLFYAISDDRSVFSPARFYTLSLGLDTDETGKIRIQKVKIEDVTFLKDAEGKPYPQGSIDPEAIALSPKDTVFISSEGASPTISEFDLKTGQLQQNLPIPERFIPKEESGIRENLGFESLTLNPAGLAGGKGDPFRLFTATESAITQDNQPERPDKATRIRLLHYLISDITSPLVISEHLYPLDFPPEIAKGNGLTDIASIDTGGHFLALERSYGILGGGAKIFQIATGGANDISNLSTLKGELRGIEFIKKKLLSDVSELGIYVDNLEAMTLGSRLPDGSRSLVLVSDDNFQDLQTTQFLLFRIKGLS